LRRLACVIVAILCVGCGGGGGGTSGTPVAAPTFSPSPGTYAPAQSVTLATATPAATIRYTMDGSTPSGTVGTVYSGQIAVPSSVTIRAVAYLRAMPRRAISTPRASSRTVYLYYTRFNDGGLDRDLVRVPVTFTLE